ncbi:MAG TPA: C4-type zinc ribbon domain-containing protein [Acidimicrobiales bacterium]|jgi:predicted  nucleic acid-binding Zn-ribbon protein|nr:C4-type zinc ribbon domain-containing protein [Acidimicrobiales bacterium]
MSDPSSPSDLERLLAVQGHDTHADQLRHRRDSLEERTTLAEANQRLAATDAEIARLEAARDELAREQKREEDAAASFVERAALAERQLYGGTVSNPRELQALQDDIASLKRHQSGHEDRVLELMEEIEPLQSEIDAQRVTRRETEAAVSAAQAGLLAAETAVDAELAEVEAQRAGSIDGIDEGLVGEYEKLRVPLGGVAIARLTGNRCDGCHLTLSAVEVDRIRHLPPDELVNCEECGRMLVH